MNAEKSTYGTRDFYGPLELSGLSDPASGRDMLVHPDDPSKLVRASHEDAYYDKNEMTELVNDTNTLLKSLGEHGVTHVNPTYLDQSPNDSTPRLMIVVDKIDSAQPYSKLLEVMPQEQIDKADDTLVSMLAYTRDVAENGGIIDPEIMHMSQFVYDTENQKFILVDVEPIGAHKIDISEESVELIQEDDVEYRLPTQLSRTVAQLCIDVLELSRHTESPLSSIRAAANAIGALPGSSIATDEAKMSLLRMLDTGEVTPDILNMSMGESLLNEDE